jgi:hypothetical protein
MYVGQILRRSKIVKVGVVVVACEYRKTFVFKVCFVAERTWQVRIKDVSVKSTNGLLINDFIDLVDLVPIS